MDTSDDAAHRGVGRGGQRVAGPRIPRRASPRRYRTGATRRRRAPHRARRSSSAATRTAAPRARRAPASTVRCLRRHHRAHRARRKKRKAARSLARQNPPASKGHLQMAGGALASISH
ncbi:hypothetical protein D0U02_23005 [Burkholderia pseudomallei]|uniref:Uncharacterized protein n=1 Tax=Burkholderia pseudomallei TaxID=28450 RepID=A0AAX0U7V7_BURPE|nr:hypothetical protein BHT10_34340 [Burkholderia pseudomallei]MUU87732.1 hypothetical protein [Burkholderia pseudomallei]NAX54923.1 hypothetical protein [Burkholderia pseudomallei]NAY60119.1 hypothetical protein [Burkholderia pseudomallei]NAY67055.1 hypothetical protein [Burkholderia pseudomallei]